MSFVDTYSVKAAIFGAEAREKVLSQAWVDFEDDLQGVVEGQIQSEEAHRLGFESAAFPLDTALAPKNRDWVSTAEHVECEFYFLDESKATTFKRWLESKFNISTARIELLPKQDWNAVWQSQFEGAEVGMFHIVPAWKKELNPPEAPGRVTIMIEPGFGFGTGTHESTQLCLTMLSELCVKRGGDVAGLHVLDFGAGSGILSIAALMSGAESSVLVEIDPLANENALHNASLNYCENRIITYLSLDEVPDTGESFDLIFANVLRPVLVEYADRLIRKLRKSVGSAIFLSGCVEADREQILKVYQRDSANLVCKEVYHQSEWLGFWIEYVGH